MSYVVNNSQDIQKTNAQVQKGYEEYWASLTKECEGYHALLTQEDIDKITELLDHDEVL